MNNVDRITRHFHNVMDTDGRFGKGTSRSGLDSRLKQVPLEICGRWFVLELVCPLLFVINEAQIGATAGGIGVARRYPC